MTEVDFRKYVENHVPFLWDRHENDARPDTRNKHSLLINFKRYLKVVQYFGFIATQHQSMKLIDVGPYPGVIAKLVKDFGNSQIEYFGVGLNFDNEYQKEMNKLGATLFVTDVDPEFIEAKECKEWPMSDADICLFLDVIEHLVNPIHCLDQINKSLKTGGHLLLTTDNISSLPHVAGMIKRGKSSNLHPLHSSVFYKGDWRPHFKEFSKEELYFYLHHCGFEVITHEYFERKQGDYYLNEHGKIYEKNRKRGLKGAIRGLICRHFPHLRDHQIIIAKKQTDHEFILGKRPTVTYSTDEWLKMRAEAGQF